MVPSFAERRSRPGRDHVRQDAANAESEQRDRDRQKSEVIVEDDGENSREREFKEKSRQRGQRNGGIEERPTGRPRRRTGGQYFILMQMVEIKAGKVFQQQIGAGGR